MEETKQKLISNHNTEMMERLAFLEKKINQALKEFKRHKIRRFRNLEPCHSIDYQILLALEKIIIKNLYSGHNRPEIFQQNRTGIPTIKASGHKLAIDVSHEFPLSFFKRTHPRLAFIELMWMLSGRTDISYLKMHGLNYWDNWTKTENGVETIGKSYGFQFTNFNGVNQVENLLKSICIDKDYLSRRHIINLWNVSDLPEMTLPPCFNMFQFVFDQFDTNIYSVDLVVTCRSSDIFLGGFYDLMFSTFFLQLITGFCSLMSKDNTMFRPGFVYFNTGDIHIYENQLDSVEQYLKNTLELMNYQTTETDKIPNVNYAEITCKSNIHKLLYESYNRLESNHKLGQELWSSKSIYQVFMDCLNDVFGQLIKPENSKDFYDKVIQIREVNEFFDYTELQPSFFKEIKTPVSI